MDQSKTIIRFSRDKNIEASRANAILALDNFLNIVGQPVIVRYYRDEAKTKIDMMLAVGIQNGKGRETYSIIYAGSPDAIIFGVSKVPGLYPDVSLLAHGELYIVKDTDGDYCYCYAINDRRHIEKITGGPYRYLNITNLSSWTFDGGELRKDNSYEKGTENDLVTGTDNESKVWDAKTLSEFVNSSLINATKFKGGFDARTGIIDGTQDTLTSIEEKIGDVYTAITAGTFAGKVLEIGDSIIFKRNVAADTEVVEDDIILVQSTVNVINKNATLGWQISKTIATIEGTDITVSLPANPNTDTKVTSVDNHYTPVINPASEVDATLVGGAGSYAKDTEYTVLTGVSAQGDAKGHITGMTYTAQKIKDTNTTYTFSDGTEGVGKFKVKSSDSDTAQEVTVSGMDSKQNKVPKLGSSTKPIYTSSEGTFAEGSTYAGGTKVTLNGSDKGAKTASIYAPESAGTEGQFLSANASGNPVWVANPNTDTKVTAVNNHYEPVADGSKEITATITGSAGSYAKDTEYTVLTGVKAQRDAKGHVTGLTYTAQKIKDTNTEYTKGSYNEIVSGTGTTGKLWDAKSIHDYVGAGASQLIISNPFISIPTDEHGVVLNDFSQEITLGLYVNDHTITTSDVQITENPPRYVTWEESLTAFPVSGITVSASTVNTPGTASASNNNLNLVNINGLYVVPTTIRVQVSQGTTLTDKGVDILAYGYDENGRLYNGSGVLFIQQHQFWIERPQFTSMVFKRATTKPSTPNGGTYDNPIPTGWQDGIPSGTGGIVWATTCVFYGDGTKSGWAEPQAQIDLDTLDIEFSPNETQPVDPDDDPALRPAQGWYNPSDLPVGKEIIWRAERKKKNGAYVGDWVVTRILGEKGEDGRSITKASADTYRYAVSNSGTVVPSSGWKNSRPTVPQGQYLWTETTIHWSDSSTTTLYGVERNPNDGVEGMSVVITSQSIDYCRRTAEQGQADPSTLTYSTYPSTLNQGDWLYTRTTVNYKDGDGHAYSTVSYSVSRIGENGANGSGISGITEYYKASSSSTNPPPRTGGSDWETNPMPSDWNMSKRYLWNYEKIAKVDSAGNITYERTTPGVIAIYTEDGKGIDSIINYYVATSHSSGVTTDNPDDGKWTTTIQTTTEQKPYLWNYEIIYYIKEGQSAGSTTTDPHIIHNFATSPYFADIDNEIQSVACEVDGKPTSSKSMVTNVSMWKGSNKLTLTNLTAALVTGENIGINREQSGGVYTGKITFTVSSSNAISEVNTISIRAYYGEIYRDLLFTINGVRGGKDAELYELVPSINNIARRKDGSYVPSGDSNITCSVVKTKGDTVSTITPGTGTGVILKYSRNGGTETAYTGGIRVDTVTSNLIFILYKEGTNTVLDRETIPLVIDGIDGTSPYFADIDNEMQSVACDKNGYPMAAKTMNAIVTMWEGTNPLTITTLTVTKLSGSGVTATATPSSGVIVFTVSPSTAISDVNTFQISVSANGVSKTLYFTVNGVRPGPDGKPATSYELVPNTTEVVKRKNGSYSPSGNITCSITKNQGGDQSTPATNEYVLKKSLNGDEEVIINTSDETAPSSIVSNLVYSLYDSTGTKLIDRETIPLIYDGNDSAQLVFSSPLISVPTDNEGVVLEDFTQEITARLMMSGQNLWFSNITVSESNPKYISWENKLNVFSTTGITVSVPNITVPNTSSVSGSKLNISSISQVYAIPSSLVVHVSKGATLSEKDIEITAAGYDTAGNEYQGYGTIRIQCQYWVEKAQFQSIVFKRSNSEPSTPTGGTYINPIPEGWEDGIPEGVGIVWASICTFYGDGTTSGWSKPQAQIDTDELDIEFSPSESQPSNPTGDPFINRELQGWYDPMSPNFSTAGTMIWRAERKVKNGEWAVSEGGEVSDWVVTRIYGEQGDTGEDAINVVLSPFAVLFSQDVSSGDGTAAQAIAQITPETITSRVVVTKGETPITTGVVVSVASTSHFNTSGVTIGGTTITLDKDGIQVYEESGKYYPYNNGYVDLNVAYNGKNYPLRLQFYVNVMGKFKTTIEGDVETSIASKTWYEYNPATGNYDKATTMGEFIRSSSKNTSTLDEQVNNPTTGLEHKYSVISQNVNNISLKVGQYYNLFYNAFFGELLADRSPYNYYTSISLVNEGTYGGKAIRMGGNYFSDSIESSIMGSDTKGYGVYLDKGTYTFQMYARVSDDYSSSSSAFAGVQLLWDDNADFSTWSSSKILYGIKVTGTSYSRYTYTFTLASARYVGFRMILGSFSIGGDSAFYLYIDAVMLEIGSTASSMISSYGGNQSGAEVGKVQRNLLATGIDIEKGKITMTADKFECQNNSGVKTAWLDNLGNFTTTGVYNNLITVIDYSKNKGKELIITEYTNETSGVVTFDLPSGGTWSYDNEWIYRVNDVNYKVEWWIDVLRCGDFVNILSLPKYGGAAQIAQYNLPYYATNDIQMRGYTRFSSGEIHQMSADELRMLVGRKMTFKIGGTGFSIPSANRYYTHIGDFFNLELFTGSSTGDALKGLGYLANGKNFYITPTSSNKTYCPCYQLVAHVEFKNTTWSSSKTSVDYSGYGYVWSYSQANMDPVDRANDGLDSWT